MEIITCHLNADFDCLASMLAARRLYPEAKLVFAGSQERNLRRYLQDTGLIFEFSRLKAIDLTQVSRLIVVDTRQKGRLGPFQRCLNNPGLELHLYDHHPDHPDTLHGQLEIIRPVGATATLMVQLFREQQLAVTSQEATTLALAIYEDTGNFTFATTTHHDLEAAGWLMEQGANIQEVVSQYISQELTSSEVALLHQLLKAATTYTIGTLPITICRLSLPDYCDEFALLVRRLMVMENLNVVIAIAAMADRVFVICRSRIPEVNVGKIAMELGGGGHASAASATVKERSLVQVEEEVISLLHKYVQPPALARELMSAPVISVTPRATIAEANGTLIRYNITVLPVVEEGEIVGLISRRDTAKAIFHQLEEQNVAAYMTTEFATVGPEASLLKIQQLIIRHRQRTIPVVADKSLKGIITRTDLFNLLAGDPAIMTGIGGAEAQPSSERTRNLASRMAQTLARPTMLLLRTIGEVADSCGFTVYAVGGFVRDLLLGQANLDYDIVVEGDGITFAKTLAEKLTGRTRIHEKFNTAKVVLTDGTRVDVATARLEYYDHPAAAPKVESSSIKLDLYRRDFTINAMAIHLNPARFGILVDFFNCQNDLKDGMIRIIHNLSFVEDPTRIFRAIRFEQRMDFQLGEHTKRQIKNVVQQGLFAARGFRFFQELRQILSEERAVPAILRLDHFHLLVFLHPQLRTSPTLITSLEQATQAISWYHLLYRRRRWRPWLVMLLALTSRLKTREVLEMAQNIEMPERYSRFLIGERITAQKAVRAIDQPEPLAPSRIFAALHELSPEGLLFAMASCRHEEGRIAVSAHVTEFSQQKGRLTGSDLIELGYQPGPRFATILARLRAAVLDGECEDRAEEMELLQREFPA
ncbi:MAG: CBS domain-containing protein [Thermodesulfobacteriota bacterium]